MKRFNELTRKKRLLNKGHHILQHWSYVVAPVQITNRQKYLGFPHWQMTNDSFFCMNRSQCIALLQIPTYFQSKKWLNSYSFYDHMQMFLSISVALFSCVCSLCVAAYRPRPHLTLTPGWPRERADCRLTGSWVVSSSYEAYSGKNILTMFLTKTLKLIETETC